MISAIVLTRNSQNTLNQCLESLKWCEELIIVDDYSTDDTEKIAKKYGAHFFKHAVDEDFSKQRNFALSLATGEWVLFLDSDEILSHELAKSIKKTVESDSDQLGYLVLRQDTILGRKMYFGEFGSNRLIRLAKKTAGRWEGKVHEEWKVNGEVGELEGVLIHKPHQSIETFLLKIDFYTTIRAKELFDAKIPVKTSDILIYPVAKFLQNYVLKSGFRDGLQGFIMALLMSFHSFLVKAKLTELWLKK